MRTLLILILWAILLLLCWPLAVIVLILWPVLWLLSIPFRFVGILMDSILAFAHALLLLPARLLGYRVNGERVKEGERP